MTERGIIFTNYFISLKASDTLSCCCFQPSEEKKYLFVCLSIGVSMMESLPNDDRIEIPLASLADGLHLQMR